MRKLLALVALLAAAGVAWYAVRNGLKPVARLDAVPEALTSRAEIPGMPGVRYWVGKDLAPFVRDMLEARRREAQLLGVAEDAMPPSSLLAVSGGGDKGAFGAGLLCGWTDAGNRPVFKGVTGISTGALIAPFAFLGGDYDHVLRTVYTSLEPQDIAKHRQVWAAITNDAMADNRPLWGQISRYADEALLKRVAEEHAKGRILLVGTTDLDARQPVIWNMGKIAASGAPRALELFRNILLASAAIPGAFPPTMIEVEVDGQKYEEMHVDGGASAQVFVYPPRMRAVAAEMGQQMQRSFTLYVIRNSALQPDWEPVTRRTISIAGPAIGSLIHTQGLGDLNRIYMQSQRDGLDFNLAYIDTDFTVPHTVDFDAAWMKQLFDYAYAQGKSGYPWKKHPPMLGAEPER